MFPPRTTSGIPLWSIADGLPAVYPRLHHDLRCDLAIIGGGITGALVAHRFAREGITVTWIAANLLLDRFLERPNPDAEIFRFDR